jgi:hypothetical protein
MNGSFWQKKVNTHQSQSPVLLQKTSLVSELFWQLSLGVTARGILVGAVKG